MTDFHNENDRDEQLKINRKAIVTIPESRENQPDQTSCCGITAT